MSTINKSIKDLFNDPAEGDLLNQAAVIKQLCNPDAIPQSQLMSFLESVIGYSGAPVSAAQGQLLSNLVANITTYVTASAVVRPFTVWTDSGGIAVLSPGQFMTTWNNLARLEIQTTTLPGEPHLWTFEPRPPSECDGTTSLRVTGNCYQIHDFPDETVAYDDPIIVTLCHPSATGPGGPAGIGHQTAATNVFNGRAEVLEEVVVDFHCAHTTAAIDSWLGREAGPLGRFVARAYDYLRPRPLFAVDAGESGYADGASLFGEILNVIFEDDFAEIDNPPDVGDAWTVQATSPGYIQVVNGEVVLSQAQGNCASCPVFRLLGTRVNGTPTETIGSYDVVWTSRQTKPNIKEAPFVVLNGNGDEIARLSYVTVSSQNRLIFTVHGASPDSVTDVGPWFQNVNQTFKITVNTTVLGSNSNTVSFEGPGLTTVPDKATPLAASLKQIGYVLTGIDAGIMVSDNWSVVRKNDVP